MTKKKRNWIIAGSVAGALALAVVIFVLCIVFVTEKQMTEMLSAGKCLSSSYRNAIIYCIDEKQYTNYLTKFILFDSDTLTLRTDDDKNEDLASVILDSQSSREYFSSSEYQDFKEIYNAISNISNPVKGGVYISYDKVNEKFTVFNIEYDKKLHKKLGESINTVSLEKCWVEAYSVDY